MVQFFLNVTHSVYYKQGILWILRLSLLQYLICYEGMFHWIFVDRNLICMFLTITQVCVCQCVLSIPGERQLTVTGRLCWGLVWIT